MTAAQSPTPAPTGSPGDGPLLDSDASAVTDLVAFVRTIDDATPAFPADTYFGSKALYRAAMFTAGGLSITLAAHWGRNSLALAEPWRLRGWLELERDAEA